MLGFRFDGELLRASAKRLLERAGVPLFRETAAAGSKSLSGGIASRTRVVPQFSDSVSKLGDFVDGWIITDLGIANFVNAEAGPMIVVDERQKRRTNGTSTHEAKLDVRVEHGLFLSHCMHWLEGVSGDKVEVVVGRTFLLEV
jgi:hypothetical protein